MSGTRQGIMIISASRVMPGCVIWICTSKPLRLVVSIKAYCSQRLLCPRMVICIKL